MNAHLNEHPIWSSTYQHSLITSALARGDHPGQAIADTYWIREGIPMMVTLRDSVSGKIGLYQINLATKKLDPAA